MSEEKPKTKHAVDTDALQAVITYLEGSTGVYKEVNKLLQDLLKGAVQVTLAADPKANEVHSEQDVPKKPSKKLKSIDNSTT